MEIEQNGGGMTFGDVVLSQKEWEGFVSEQIYVMPDEYNNFYCFDMKCVDPAGFMLAVDMLLLQKDATKVVQFFNDMRAYFPDYSWPLKGVEKERAN